MSDIVSLAWQAWKRGLRGPKFAYKTGLMKITNYYEHAPISGNPPKQIVLLLHGLGSDGRDLISLAPAFAQDLPDAVFVSPDAPFQCDMSPFGYPWFSLMDWSVPSMLRGVKTAAPILLDFMDEQLARFNLPASKMALVGFSQGTMMSLYAGPRHADPIAGVLGYSGALIGENEGAINHKVPVHLIHGQADTVVPVMAYHHARTTLEGMGFPVGGHTSFGLMHSIDEKGIAAGWEFLRRVLLG